MPLFNPPLDTGRVAFCGPAVISILTGVPVSRAELMIRRGRKGGHKARNGRKLPIRGVYTWEVIRVLKRLGCKVVPTKITPQSLTRFVDDIRYAGTFLVEVTAHFMAATQGVVADNTFPTGVAVETYNHGRRQVKRAWKVLAPALPKYTIDDALAAERPKKPKPDVRLVRAKKTYAAVKRWERKEKLAKTKLKKLRTQLKYYMKLGVI